MHRFITGHATHPDAHMALALAAAQVEAARSARTPAMQATLGWVYLTDHFAAQAEAVLAELQQRWPGVAWSGCVGVGVLASGVEYFDEPGLVLMLADLPAAQFQVFNGRQPLGGFRWHSALVHADPTTPELQELITELAGRTATGYLFGGLASSRSRQLHIAGEVLQGGLSGVGWGPGVTLVSRVTQGSQPVGPTRRISACEGNVVLELDGQVALPLLLADLNIDLRQTRAAMATLRTTLAGITDGETGHAPGQRPDAIARPGQFGADTRVRHLVGIDPARAAVAIAERVEVGQQLAFCRRDVEAARRDLVRICSEIREELEGDASGPGSDRIAGALYISCNGRGGPHFGGPSAEARIIQHALGDVPLAGFFAGGEIARHHLYGYTGVLTVFVAA